MNADNIISLLTKLGCAKIKRGGNGWVHACCPLAPWYHKGGSDSKPSFAVAVSHEGLSNYKCLSCQQKGDLKSLIYKIERRSGKSLGVLMDFVHEHDQPSMELLKRRVEASTFWGTNEAEIGGVMVQNPPYFLLHPEEGRKEKEPLDESELQAFTTDFPKEVWDYLTQPKGTFASNGQEARGLTPETIKEWELCWNPKRKRIGIPVRDVKGQLRSISVRAWFGWQKPKFLHTTGFDRDLYLYGENKVEKGGVGILVEGHFDVQRIRQVGFPLATAVMGSFLSEIQAEKVCQFFSHALIIPDGDKAGADAAKQWAEALKGRVPTRTMHVGEGSDPDELEAPQIEPEIKKLLAS